MCVCERETETEGRERQRQRGERERERERAEYLLNILVLGFGCLKFFVGTFCICQTASPPVEQILRERERGRKRDGPYTCYRLTYQSCLAVSVIIAEEIRQLQIFV